MPLYDSVANPETGAIQRNEWDTHVREHRPVGVCEDCGCDLYGSRADVDYGRVYRDVACRKGHERTIPGPYFKGVVVARPDALFTPAPGHLRAVPDPD